VELPGQDREMVLGLNRIPREIQPGPAVYLCPACPACGSEADIPLIGVEAKFTPLNLFVFSV